MLQVLGLSSLSAVSSTLLVNCPEQPVRPRQGQPLHLGQTDQLLGRELLSRGLWLLLQTHNIQCRLHGTSPLGSAPSASDRNTLKSTVPLL